MKIRFMFLQIIIGFITTNSFAQNNVCCVHDFHDNQNCFETYSVNSSPESAAVIVQRVGIDTIVCNQMYVVYSGSSYVTNLNNIFTTSNIFIIKGVVDTVWIFGTGYGGRDTLTAPQYTSTRPALADVLDADSVIRYYFGMNPSQVKLNYVVPHKHFDHINWEFVTSLFDTLGYSRTGSKIYVHANDYSGAYNNLSVLDQPLLQSLGAASDPACSPLLMTFTSAMGTWEVWKGDINHTTGTINMDNANYQIRIEGAAAMPGCTLPANWYELGVHKSMDNYIDTVFCATNTSVLENIDSENNFITVFPNPATETITISFQQSQNINITITDELGRNIYEQKNISDKTLIRCNDFSRGIYFIQATNQEGEIIATKKLIIN